MKTSNPVILSTAATLVLALALGGCGEGSVEGSTYEGADGSVKIEFKSGGKAFASLGGISSECSYTQSGKSVTLSCQGEKDVFTVNDDGSLSGPPARLTKKKA